MGVKRFAITPSEEGIKEWDKPTSDKAMNMIVNANKQCYTATNFWLFSPLPIWGYSATVELKLLVSQTTIL